METTDKIRVLFLCTGNSARSQMAEAFVRTYGGDRFDPYSAGVEPRGLNPLTVQVMSEIGIDVSGYRSKGMTEYLGKAIFQYMITVCDEAEKNCPTAWPGVELKDYWSFEDPSAFVGTDAEKLEKFRAVRDQIKQRVVAWIDSLPK